MIQGYNTMNRLGTGREILKETVTYTIIKGKLDVSVSIEALENITILRYYGLQTFNPAWNGRIYYVNGENAKGISSYKSSDSGSKSSYPNVSKYYLCSEKGNNKLTAWLDRSYGLGKMENVSKDKPCAFTASYGKSYFNLIHGDGMEKQVQKGFKLYWRGGYIFSKY